MSSWWLGNLVAYSVQVALVVLAGGLAAAALRLKQPRVVLAYWQADAAHLEIQARHEKGQTRACYGHGGDILQAGLATCLRKARRAAQECKGKL
jgi:hypothetical protein